MESLFAVYHKALKGNASGSKRQQAAAKEINRARRDSGKSFCLATSARSEKRMVPMVQYQVQNKTIALSSIVSYYGSRRTQLMDRNIAYVFVGR